MYSLIELRVIYRHTIHADSSCIGVNCPNYSVFENSIICLHWIFLIYIFLLPTEKGKKL